MKGKGPALETGQPLPPIAHVCDLRLVAYTFWASLSPSISWGSKDTSKIGGLQDRRAARNQPWHPNPWVNSGRNISCISGR